MPSSRRLRLTGLAAFLTVNHRTSRTWSDADKAVARQTADRLWAARERGRAEAALRESERRYHALFAASPVPFLVLAADPPDYTITAANDAYLAAALTTRETLIGRLRVVGVGGAKSKGRGRGDESSHGENSGGSYCRRLRSASPFIYLSP